MEENKEINEEEIKEEGKEEPKEEVKEEKKKGSPVVGVILICVCLIVGVICFYLGTMFAKKEQVTTTTTTKETSTTTTESTKKEEEEVTTTTTTQAVESDNGHKNYDKPDEPTKVKKTKNYTDDRADEIHTYKYDEYEMEIYDGYMDEEIQKLTIGKKKIDVKLFENWNIFHAIHRFKNYILVYGESNSCDSGTGYLYLFDYEGNILFNSTQSEFVKSNPGMNIQNIGGYEYNKEKKELYLKYEEEYNYSSLIEYIDYDDEDDEDELSVEERFGIDRNLCVLIKNDYIVELKSKVNFNSGKVTETKVSDKKAYEIEGFNKVRNYCKKDYNIEIK